MNFKNTLITLLSVVVSLGFTQFSYTELGNGKGVGWADRTQQQDAINNETAENIGKVVLGRKKKLAAKSYTRTPIVKIELTAKSYTDTPTNYDLLALLAKKTPKKEEAEKRGGRKDREEGKLELERKSYIEILAAREATRIANGAPEDLPN